jgi:hypothetical protein
MKKLMIAVMTVLLISAVDAHAQSTTNSTNPKQSSADTTKQNQFNNTSTTGQRKTVDGGKHDKNEKAGPPGKATNAGSRTNANNESKVSKGGRANAPKSGDVDQPAKKD